MATKNPRHVLRNILRKVKASKSSEGSQPFREFVLSSYKSTATSAVQAQQQQQQQQISSDYSMLLSEMSERLRLQKLDAGAEEQLTPKELSRRAAARAGLQLPKLNPDL